MDRGFGSFRGPAYNNSTPRQVSDRRYDDFYSDGRRGGQGGGRSFGGGGGGGGGRRDWGAATTDPGFFNQVQGARNSGPGNVGGQIIAAALQQQQQNILTAFMSSQQQSRGILPAPTPTNSQFQGRRNDSSRYGNRPGDKRKSDQRPSGFQNKKKPAPTPSKSESKKSVSEEKKAAPPPKEEEEIDIPDSEVEIPDSLMDNVQKLRQRTEIRRNVADEDVQKLAVFCFTGKGYQCLTCGLLLTKESAFLSHLDGKSHVMNVIDARTAKKYQEVRDILDIDLGSDDWYEQSESARKIILKQAKMITKTQREIKQREIDNYNKNPANFFTVTMETRKAAIKRGTTVTIKSIVETSMEVKEFGSDRHFGCEFIKAVSGFNCRLCGLHINDSDGVIPHVESRLHKTNYQNHLRKTPTYEKVQTDQNKELRDALAEHEDCFVLLSESAKAGEQTFLASMEDHLVRVPELFKPDPSDKNVRKEQESAEAKVKTTETSDVKKDENNTENNSEDENTGVNVDSKESDEPSASASENYDENVSGASSEVEPSVTAATEQFSTFDANNKNEENGGAESTEHPQVEPEQMETGTASEERVNSVEQIDLEDHADSEVQIAESPKPKKSILKKTPTRTPRGASNTAKRGRGRGKATPSPRTARAKRTASSIAATVAAEEEAEGDAEETDETAYNTAEPEEDSMDGNFMDGFEVVDEA